MKKNRPVSILVVDDDKTHRIMLKAMLKQWGWQIEERSGPGNLDKPLSGKSATF